MKSPAESGRHAEDEALAHLKRQGLKTLERNWRCRRGELDLIMRDGDTIVFVEIRQRQHGGWGGALASVDGRKREKIILAARHYLHEHPRFASSPCRFDVVTFQGSGNQSRLDWIKNAFDT